MGPHVREDRSLSETDDEELQVPRDDRQFVGWPGVLPVGPCFTSKGVLGRCTSFRQCYPYFKLPELSNWETWILGMYDTCSYFTSSGRQVRTTSNGSPGLWACTACASSGRQVRNMSDNQQMADLDTGHLRQAQYFISTGSEAKTISSWEIVILRTHYMSC